MECTAHFLHAPFLVTLSSSSSMGGHIVRGAAWMVAMRWMMRGVGLINTVVLARILSPDDFGIMAMSALVVEFLMLLGDTNVDIADSRPGICATFMTVPGQYKPYVASRSLFW